MRRGQPTVLFLFTALVGVGRLFAYAGMPLGQELSLAAVVHFVALHLSTFGFAAFLVAALSRATATRAVYVALYAQALLFLAPFVDIGLGLSLGAYEATYTGILGGSPGSIVASVAYGALLAWGVRDASRGTRAARDLSAVVAFVVSALGLSFLAIPWPRFLLAPFTWGLHLALAVYHGALATAFFALAMVLVRRRASRGVWRQAAPWSAVGFALLPFVGIVAAGRLALPLTPTDPIFRLQVEAPYMMGAAAVAVALWFQQSLVRTDAWGAFRMEVAAIAKLGALAVALLLGLAPFLAAGAAGSLVWLERSRRNSAIFGAIAALAVLVGDLTVVAVSVVEIPVGPSLFIVPLDQYALPSLAGLLAAASVAILGGLGDMLVGRAAGSPG